MRLYSLPTSLYSLPLPEHVAPDPIVSALVFGPYLSSLLLSRVYQSIPWQTPSLAMHEGELIYDYTWYPQMHSTEPATCWLVFWLGVNATQSGTALPAHPATIPSICGTPRLLVVWHCLALLTTLLGQHSLYILAIQPPGMCCCNTCILF
jgi:hypothetical protein